MEAPRPPYPEFPQLFINDYPEVLGMTLNDAYDQFNVEYRHLYNQSY